MAIPDDPYNGGCCCNFGVELSRNSATSHVYYSSPSAVWNPAPGGGSETARFFRRNQSDFEPTYWDNTLIPQGADLTTDDLGNIYVSNGSEVRKLDQDRNSVWSTQVAEPGIDAPRPWVDANSNVWSLFGDALNPNNLEETGIVKLDANGDILWKFTQYDADPAFDELTDMHGLAVSLNGYSYVSWNQSGSAWLSRVTPSGTQDWIEQIESAGGAGALVWDIAVDTNGNVYAIMPRSPNIRCYDTSGSLVWSRDFESGIVQSTISSVRLCLCFDQNGDLIASGAITDGATLRTWAIKKINTEDQADIWETSLPQGVFPRTIACGKRGRVYLACNRQIGAASSAGSQRQYLSDGSLAASDLIDVRQDYCAAVPGRYPHFV